LFVLLVNEFHYTSFRRIRNIGNIFFNIFVMDRLAVFFVFVVPSFSMYCGDGTLAKLWVHAAKFFIDIQTTNNNLNPTI